MKKLTLLAVTTLTMATLSSQTLTVQAASKSYCQVRPCLRPVVFTYSSDCSNLQSILDKLGNCFPNITLPDTNAPEENTPEVELPENSTPEVEAPETNAPETNKPETSLPENDSTEETIPEEDTTTDEHAFIKEVVALVNAERAKEGLSPLTIDVNVQAAAQVRAQECEQLFSHTRPDGSSFSTALKEQNVSYRRAGENIAWGQKTPEAVMNAWMNSSGHRANIMNSQFTTIGVGYYVNANRTPYWCQLFTS